MTASGLLLVDKDGSVLEGEGQAETSAFGIHAPIHLRHGRANAVLHTHMPYTPRNAQSGCQPSDTS